MSAVDIIGAWRLRIHVDQAHLYGSERIGEPAVAAVALVIEPLAFGPQ